jgi:hypothetical protein
MIYNTQIILKQQAKVRTRYREKNPIKEFFFHFNLNTNQNNQNPQISVRLSNLTKTQITEYIMSYKHTSKQEIKQSKPTNFSKVIQF